MPTIYIYIGTSIHLVTDQMPSPHAGFKMTSSLVSTINEELYETLGNDDQMTGALIIFMHDLLLISEN